MRIFNGKLNLTVVGGSAQGNITNLNCLCHQLIVSPTNETTQYTFQIINQDSKIVFERVSEIGTLAELTMLPLLGNYTFNILASTSDEAFSISVMSRED